MSDAVEIWERPHADEMFMIAGWRQWADAGSISSGLPHYLIQRTGAKQIGQIRADGFYLFQFPGTHDLVRPVIKFKEGHPESLQAQRNELYYAGDEKRGVIFFLGDEPHLDIDRYVGSILEAARTLGVKRLIGLGGVYAEVPFDKERVVSCIYSLPELKKETEDMAVNLSDYQGGASIGSYLCRRAGEQGMEFFAFYGFAPTYDFSSVTQIGNTIRIENDFMAWLGIMRRINYILKIGFDLSDLEEKSQELIHVVEEKVDELDHMAPQLGVRDYFSRLSDEFTEAPFAPMDEFWDEELRRIFDKFDTDDTSSVS